jgi:hypothetical protein
VADLEDPFASAPAPRRLTRTEKASLEGQRIEQAKQLLAQTSRAIARSHCIKLWNEPAKKVDRVLDKAAEALKVDGKVDKELQRGALLTRLMHERADAAKAKQYSAVAQFEKHLIEVCGLREPTEVNLNVTANIHGAVLSLVEHMDLGRLDAIVERQLKARTGAVARVVAGAALASLPAPSGSLED